MDPVMLFYQAVPDLAKEMWGYLDPAGAKGLGMTHNSIESSRLCKLFEEGKLERCFCRINSSLSFLSPLPPSVNFIGPWITPMKIVPMIIEHHKKHSTNSPSHLSVTAPVFESSSTRLPIKATGWESNTPDQAPPPPSNQQGRSPISMMTPIKPSPQPSIKATGWGDDPTAVTPEPLNEGNNDQGYGFNHDDRTRPPVKSPPRSPSDWNQTPWRNEPSPTDAILTPVTNLSSGSGGSKWESSIAATEQMTPHSPFHINEGKMGEESRASGGGDSIEGGGNIHNQVEKKAPAQLEERLFKAGASSESKLPIWYYMDQMDPDKSIYGPFDPNQMISFYLEASLGPTIFLCGLDPSAASSLESALPPKTLFRPLPQLERLCLSDGEGSEELRCYTAIDEIRLKEARSRTPMLGREPPPGLFAAYQEQNDDSSYDRDQEGGGGGYAADAGEEGGEQDEPIAAAVATAAHDQPAAAEDGLGKDWGKDWGA